MSAHIFAIFLLPQRIYQLSVAVKPKYGQISKCLLDIHDQLRRYHEARARHREAWKRLENSFKPITQDGEEVYACDPHALQDFKDVVSAHSGMDWRHEPIFEALERERFSILFGRSIEDVEKDLSRDNSTITRRGACLMPLQWGISYLENNMVREIIYQVRQEHETAQNFLDK